MRTSGSTMGFLLRAPPGFWDDSPRSAGVLLLYSYITRSRALLREVPANATENRLLK